jgi:hypothetical protein
VRVGPVLAGAGICALWLLLIGLLAHTAGGYVWLTLFASIVAWGCAFVLAKAGDRGAAVGVAMVTGLGLAVAVGLVVQRWIATGWPLW